MPEPNRPEPRLPVQAFKTYALLSPISTHRRPATCAEVHCTAYERGWTTRVPRTSDLAEFIRAGTHGRRFTETTMIDGAEAEFMFPPGQPCFRAGQHTVPLEREPLYIVRGGDWRGNPTGEKRQHVRAADWVDDFAEHQDRIAGER